MNKDQKDIIVKRLKEFYEYNDYNYGKGKEY
jgi:hypothetical protein